MQENIPLSEHTTFKLGGRARYFFRVHSIKETREALDFARENSLPFFVLGGGSNLLVSENGFSGVIIKNEILGLSFKEEAGGTLVTAGAGENWDNFVSECVSLGLYGLENLSGIPGTVGAAPVQNIGAYGVEAKDSIVSVETLEADTDAVRNFSAAECGFGYRDSFFKTAEGKSYIITGVTFRLKENGVSNLGYKDLKNYFGAVKAALTPSLSDVRKAVLEIRSKKFPDLKTTGTAGSFFKNPIIPQAQFDELKKRFPDLPGFPLQTTNYKLQTIKIPLAWILDNILHLKGFMDGPVGLHEAQPLVIVHTGGGNAEDVRRLAKDVASKIKDATGVEVSWEVEYLG
ncbi:MAG: UDP-N-acetylenolpyruvoylglucosamine reductase [Candidatus Kaiserbacteria bacterium GW2011_GWA2_49_19]|uniref:UDP-N-acetylenolpyruvoylglucosamine reductase n=1 Tax=Candidatus Kaiserbacteria bacterium GW2011_GWA2_49_19 TaxID=1618669 RepID=A0A0G1Y3P5_9BACT|nr:MAG: UDP-N-acetylenolpyruvoylglucosamine reductase [Candidatus Kaiserbacteria bacterium GW2011_GWA2_49_19]